MLQPEDIEYIKNHIGEWLSDKSLSSPPVVYEVELRERMVRVEEELKHQRELMLQGFKQTDKRIDQIDKRIDQMDKHIEQVNKNFEQVDKRFEQVDKHFEQVDKRFEQFDRHFDAMIRRIDRFMFWSFGVTVSVGGIIIATLKLWPN